MLRCCLCFSEACFDLCLLYGGLCESYCNLLIDSLCLLCFDRTFVLGILEECLYLLLDIL